MCTFVFTSTYFWDEFQALKILFRQIFRENFNQLNKSELQCELTWCWGAGCGWCWAPAALADAFECVSKAACVLGHWRSVGGCGASCSGGCSTCLSPRLGWRGRGFATGNSAAPHPGSSAGNTARPRTHGSANKRGKRPASAKWAGEQGES